MFARQEDILLFYRKRWTQSGTFKDCDVSDTQNELFPCAHAAAWEIIITCDCCGSCSVELHLHKNGLYVTNACRQDFTLTCPSTHTSRWYFKLFDCLGGSEPKQSHTSIQKEYFYLALCIKQRAFYSLMYHFKLRSPTIPTCMSPRLCNTLNAALSKHKTFSYQRQNFILSLEYMKRTESIFTKGNIFVKLPMKILPQSCSLPT